MTDDVHASGVAATPRSGDRIATEETVRVYWRVVNNETGGIVICFDDRTDLEYQAKAKAQEWRDDLNSRATQYHLERWEQRWWSTPADWTRTDPGERAPEGPKK